MIIISYNDHCAVSTRLSDESPKQRFYFSFHHKLGQTNTENQSESAFLEKLADMVAEKIIAKSSDHFPIRSPGRVGVKEQQGGGQQPAQKEVHRRDNEVYLFESIMHES